MIGVVTALALGACAGAKPTLRANIANGAHNVPLETSLQIIAEGALIQQALLVRLDVPSEPMTLEKTATGAEIAAKLEPDAKYKLAATAEPATKNTLPWDSTPLPQISFEQVFSTVETPVLDDPDSTRIVLRDKPVELKFSQPLALASVKGQDVTASISTKDPRILEIQIADPTPGADLSIRVTDVVGQDGVAAPDSTLHFHVPSAIRLTGLSDKSISTKVGLPVDAQAVLQWSRPVSFVRYTVDDEAKTWNGNAADSVPLPFKAEEGKSRMVSVVDAVAADGGWLTAPQSFEVMTAAPLRLVAMWPENGEKNVTPSSAPVFRFSDEIGDRAAAEAAISFEPAVPGTFDWLAPNRVRFLPESAFPASTDVTIKVDGNPRRIKSATGGYLEEAVTTTYTTGRYHRSVEGHRREPQSADDDADGGRRGCEDTAGGDGSAGRAHSTGRL
jgi:hypothetical protein